MSNNKGNKDMQTQAVKTEVIDDINAVLSLNAVHGYTDRHVKSGHAEYNGTGIKVRSQHPLDQCLKRSIIEDEHFEIGKRLRNYRDCANSKLSGRTYNASGDGESEMDAATVYAHLLREMNSSVTRRRQWQLVSIVCFTEPNIDGKYLNEADYSMLYGVAPNIQYALAQVDEVIMESRKVIQKKIDAEKKRLENEKNDQLKSL